MERGKFMVPTWYRTVLQDQQDTRDYMSLTSPKTSRKASPPSSCIQTPRTFIMASRPSYPPPPSCPKAAACHSLAQEHFKVFCQESSKAPIS